jgi:hypothetical protein
MTDVIEWLRSPEGEAWSRDRIAAARKAELAAISPTENPFMACVISPTEYGHGNRDSAWVSGMFSIRKG